MSNEEAFASITIVTNASGQHAVVTDLQGEDAEQAFTKLFTSLINGEYNQTIIRSLFDLYSGQTKLVPQELVDTISKVLRENAIKKIVDVDEIPVIRPLNALTNMSMKEGE